MNRPSNCSITVHRKMKAEIFCGLRLQESLGYPEGTLVAIRWHPTFAFGEIYRHPRGNEWKRKFPIGKTLPGARPVGKSRVVLSDLDIKPLPRFQPVTELQCWIGNVNGSTILELSAPLQLTSARSLAAYRRDKKLRKKLREEASGGTLF